MQVCSRLALLRKAHEISRLRILGCLAMGEIKSESFFLPQHAGAEIAIELRGDEQGRLTPRRADRSSGGGLALQCKLFAGADVELWNYSDAALFRSDQEEHVIDAAFAGVMGCESDQFQSRRRPVDQRVNDGNAGRFGPLTKNSVVLKTSEREFDDGAEVFHASGERLAESVSQVAGLANDGFPGIVGETDG